MEGEGVEKGLKSTMMHTEFNPQEIMTRLVDFAKMHGTSFDQFIDDIRDLLSTQSSSKMKEDEGSEKSGLFLTLMTSTNALTPPLGFFGDGSLIKKMEAVWNNEMIKLKAKYNISEECAGPDSITDKRLALMFPNLCYFGQKPYKPPGHLHSIVDYVYIVNPIFGCEELGGLIPKHAGVICDSDRVALIGLHLYSMMYLRPTFTTTRFPTSEPRKQAAYDLDLLCLMLKQRMEKSALSDEARVQFLMDNGIIVKVDETNRPIRILYDHHRHVPQDFKKRINWNMFKSEEVPMKIALELMGQGELPRRHNWCLSGLEQLDG